jgi:hypothetical protein
MAQGSSESVVTIVCNDCQHSAELQLTEAQSRKSRVALKFRCDCGGSGTLVDYASPGERAKQCANCKEPISEQRLKAVPGTRLCVECARSGPDGDKRKFVEDSWGSREAFKRDKRSWRR